MPSSASMLFGPLGAPTLGGFSIDACTLSSAIMIPGAAKWAAGKLGRSPIYRRFPHCESVRHPLFALQLTFRVASKKQQSRAGPFCHRSEHVLATQATPRSPSFSGQARRDTAYPMSHSPITSYFSCFSYPRKHMLSGLASNRFTIVMRNSLPPLQLHVIYVRIMAYPRASGEKDQVLLG